MAKSKKKSSQPKGQSLTEKLELPEGYKPGNSTDMSRKNKGGKTKGARKIEAANRDKELAEQGVARLPYPQLLAPVQRRLNRLLEELAEELGLDMDPLPNAPRLEFNAGRKWRSIKNAAVFLKEYETFQLRKLDPVVFAQEEAGWGQDKEATYIDWYQQHRYARYKTQGRLRTLLALKQAANWPNIPDIMTRAPFVRTGNHEHRYVANPHNLDQGFIQIMAIPELASGVLKHLAVYGFMDLSNLSKTCHAVFDIVGKCVEIWDITPPGDFLGDDIRIKADDKVQRTPVTLMVTPIRKEWSFEHGKRPDTSYDEHFQTETKLFRALDNRANIITNLQLHRMQFLDINAVRCIIASLPKLELLGIYQCQLLHLGNMSQLLDVIKDHPHCTGDQTSSVKLDIFPMFHQGPNNILRHGSYGATWNNPAADMTAAIAQLVVYDLYPKAKHLGIDILRWGCAFRHFLEKCPMRKWAVLRICEVIASIEHAGNAYQTEDDTKPFLKYNTAETKWQRFADDLTAAVKGDGVEPAVVSGDHLTMVVGGVHENRARSVGWWRRTKECSKCNVTLLASFFAFGEGHCWLCLAKPTLRNGGWDHFKTHRRNVAALVFGKNQTLAEALEEPFIEAGLVAASKIDVFRHLEMVNGHGTDEPDWATHPDIALLHRRYARYYEPHAGLDRKHDDCQYSPVGKYESGITSQMVPGVWADYCVKRNWERYLSREMEKWDVQHPLSQNLQDARETVGQRAHFRRLYFQERRAYWRARLIRERNERDAFEVESVRAEFNRRARFPNRQIKCWDEIIQDVFIGKDINGRDGKDLKGPWYLADRRPLGPLGAF